MIVAALIGLGANVVDVANGGSSGWNFVAIACFTVMLFVGFEIIARTGATPPASSTGGGGGPPTDEAGS